jgi:FKBP-type peptidyl-prolyl cis-trans isomerase
VTYRYLVPVLLLIGLAIFLVMRDLDAHADSESDSKKESRGAMAANRSTDAGDDNGASSRVKSKRVLRDRRGPVTTASGLQYEVLQEGTGSRPGPESKVTVHYVGTLADGTVFDSSRDRGQPATFLLNQVIKGWTEGLQLMKEGAIYRFEIPPDLAYGERGAGPSIPGNSILTFEVELLEVTGP